MKTCLKGRRIRQLARLLQATTTLSVLAAPAAWAQSDTPPAVAASPSPSELEEIVVTARRTQERLQDVPVAVTALSGETLRVNNVLRTEDLQTITPGLTVAPSQRSDTAPNYTIRGQRGVLNPGPLTDPAVAVYFADMNQSRSQGTNQAMFDLSSVQVLKGPQGTLFGRNSTGGAVLITPTAPSRAFEAYLQFSLGNYDFRDYEGMINIPLGDKVQIRAGGKISRRGGYLENVQLGVKANDLDAEAFRLQIAMQPFDGIETLFIGTRYKADQVGTAQKWVQFIPAGIPSSITGAARTFLLNYYQTEVAANAALGRYQYRNANPVGVKEDTWSIQNNTTIDLGSSGMFGDLTLKNVIGYRSLNSEYNDNRISQILSVRGETYSRLFTEELQLQGDGKYLDFILGGFYYRETGRDFFTQQNFLVLSAVNAASFPSYSTPDVDIKTDSYAFFAHVNYDLASLVEGLSVAGGIRYTKDRKKAAYRTISYRGLNPTAFACALTGQPVARYDRALCNVPAGPLSSEEFTYDASISYKFAPEMLAYVAHRRGYRSGSFNQNPSPNSIFTQTYDPEFVDDIELGVKSEFHIGDAPARLNLAGYSSSYKDIQRQVQVPNPATGSASSQIVNAAKAKIKGVEVEFTVRPIDRLSLSANYAYTDASYERFFDTYVGTGGALRTIDISDSLFSYVPKHQYSFTINYKLPVDESLGDVAFNATVFGQSSRADVDIYTANCGVDGLYLNCLNRQEADAFKLRRYALVNLRLDWRRVGGGRIDAAIFVNNAFDKYYATHNANNINALGTLAQGVGAPRMFGIQLRANLGAPAQ